MRIMEWHQKVFLRFFLFHILLDFKATAIFLPLFLFFYYFCFFAQAVYFIEISIQCSHRACEVKILRVWLFIDHAVLFSSFWRNFETLLWFMHKHMPLDAKYTHTKHFYVQMNSLFFLFFFGSSVFSDKKKRQQTKRKQKPKHNDNKSVEKCGEQKMTQTFCELLHSQTSGADT